MSEGHCLCIISSSYGTRTRKEGGWGRTLTLPMRLAMDEATSIEAEQIMLVVKKMEARLPSGRENLLRKKYVSQDLYVVSYYSQGKGLIRVQ